MTDKLKEDTVSADRKERIIFDPEAWRKSDKSGRKTSAITSRQNFDNEKFTRKADKKEAVDEGTIQPSGDSKVESAGPTQSDTISQDKKVKKSNNPQIEFVTGTATPNGSSSTSTGGAQAMGRKVTESVIEKAIKRIQEKQQYAGLEAEDKPGKKSTEFKGSKNAVTGKTVEGWKDEKAPVKEEAEHVEESCKDEKKKKQSVKKEETTMSKTYNQFMEELDQLVEFVVEENQLNEYNAKDGVYRHKGTYGGGYVDPEGADDADDKPKAAPAPAVKRGRGRPAGSYGTYKARSAETKAAAAAKSAATKAANKAK